MEIDLSLKLKPIRLLITDVDGVLTDGGLYYSEAGESIKKFHVRDGLGIKLLQACGIEVAVVSGRDSRVLRTRLADLGIVHFRLGVKDKFDACNLIIQALKLHKAQVAYIGDDVIDLPGFCACGFNYTVADAPPYVAEKADRILKLSGGAGAFREAADEILLATGNGHVLRTPEGYASVMSRMSQ